MPDSTCKYCGARIADCGHIQKQDEPPVVVMLPGVRRITDRMVIAIPLLDLAMDKPVIMAVWPVGGVLAKLTEDSVEIDDYFPHDGTARDSFPIPPGLYVWEGDLSGFNPDLDWENYPELLHGEWRKMTAAEFEYLNHGETPWKE